MAEFEDRLKTEAQEWAWVSSSSLDEGDWRALKELVCEHPDAWWRVINAMLEEAPPEFAGNLGMAPLHAIFSCDDGKTKAAAIAAARTQNRVASAVAEVLGPDQTFSLLGAEFVISTYIRYLADLDPFNAWASEMVEERLEGDSHDAWLMVLKLIDAAPNADIRGMIAAGPLENFILANASAFIEQIELTAGRNRNLKDALAGVRYSNLPDDLFDRIQTAAGVPLPRL